MVNDLTQLHPFGGAGSKRPVGLLATVPWIVWAMCLTSQQSNKATEKQSNKATANKATKQP
eukprot:9234020-Karenia_brevis.AAC.1